MGEAVRLNRLGVGVRVGLTFLVLTLLGGMGASLAHLVWHHEGRDGEAGVSLVDIEGAYHGVEAPAAMRRALERGHPEGLESSLREALLAWLDSGDLSRDYDNFDLGDRAPAEVIAANCVSCHSRGSEDVVAREIPLEYWDDVQRVSYGRSLSPTDVKILAASTHTHAISLAVLGVVVVGLVSLTSWPRAVVGWLAGLIGVSLAVDIGCWWAAREVGGLAWLIVASGGVFNGVVALSLVGVVVEMWRPESRAG